MNVKEELMPLIKFLNKDRSLNTIDDHYNYIEKMLKIIWSITEVSKSFDTKCGKCVHYSICGIQRICDDNNVFVWIDVNNIAWICSKFKLNEETMQKNDAQGID